jgi:hypothetical protein
MPVAWGLATPKLGEREVAAALLGLASDQGLLRPGMVIAADKGREPWLSHRCWIAAIVHEGGADP